MISPIIERIQMSLRKLTRNPTLDIDVHSSASSIDGWDSLTHIMLLSELEESFGISFAMSEVRALRNVGELSELIETKLGKRSREPK